MLWVRLAFRIFCILVLQRIFESFSRRVYGVRITYYILFFCCPSGITNIIFSHQPSEMAPWQRERITNCVSHTTRSHFCVYLMLFGLFNIFFKRFHNESHILPRLLLAQPASFSILVDSTITFPTETWLRDDKLNSKLNNIIASNRRVCLITFCCVSNEILFL